MNNANPVQLPPCTVPRSVMPKLKLELTQMEEQGIIRPCPETTDWVHNLVLTCKKNGDLRVCLDSRNLNCALIRNIHYTASWEDSPHSFTNGQLFSTLDAKSSYCIKFNPEKCTIKKREVEYFGRLVLADGVKPFEDKVRALLRMSHPETKQQLQSYIGTLNFMSVFIPNLAQKTFLMRGLLKNNVQYVWTSDMQKEFENAQKAIAEATLLHHFNPKLPVIIETDASLKGIGAVLMQDGRPVRFLSKSLTPAESNYSNIERELLAVLHACEKLHVSPFGHPVYIHTDHKPLENIFQKPVSLAPPRLQRMLTRLKYV